jgi:AICAR transformylase/IMP cyclohydrolase PurH
MLSIMGSDNSEIVMVFCFSVFRDVSEVTGFPEMLGGRVKTLHPAVHAGKWLVASV